MKYTPSVILLSALLAPTGFAAIPSALPSFKSERQLTTWRAEQVTKSTTALASESAGFYTGKPYLDSSKGYAFKYRTYTPIESRWTSEDPSGFPDGANSLIYTPVPTSMVDPDGLTRTEVGRSIVPGDVSWQSGGYSYFPTNSAVRTAYQYRIDYNNDWTQTTIGSTGGSGMALNGSVTIGLTSTTTIQVGAGYQSSGGTSITVGGSYSTSGSLSQTLTLSQSAIPGVSWEGYVLAIQATVYQQSKVQQWNGSAWVDNSSWGAETSLGAGYTATYGLTYFKNE